MSKLAVILILAAALLAGCEPRDVAPGGAGRPNVVAGGPSVGAEGNASNLYVFQTQGRSDEAAFQFWQRDARGAWHEGGTGRGEIAAATAWREHLLVFFPSGRYGLFGLSRPVIEPSPVPAWTPAAACEDGLSADAFGWNSAGEPIHARYEDEKWTWRRVEAALERDKCLDVSAVRFRGRFYLVWREEVPTLTGGGPAGRVKFVYLDKNKWHGPEKSRLAVAAAPLVASDGETLACLFRKGAAPADGWFLATYAVTDEDFHEVGPVAGTIPPGPAALARAGRQFFVAALGEKGPLVAPIDVKQAALESLAPFAMPVKKEEAEDDGPSLMLFVMALVAGLLIMGTWVRARRVAAGAGGPEAAPPPIGLAPLWRRGAAMAVDYFLLGLVLLAVILVAAPEALALLQADPWGGLSGLPWAKTLLVQGTRVALIMAYFTVCEGFFGRTLGKALLGIEVRSETGAPPTLPQAAVRSALRFVDEMPLLYLLGLALAIASPRRQRLGDRAARTVVVLRMRESGRTGE